MDFEYTHAPPLLKLYVHLQDRQNLVCPQNASSSSFDLANTQGRPSLTAQSVIQTVKEALSRGLRTVRLCGPGSLCAPDLDQLLDELEKHELAIEIETNGEGLTPQRVSRLTRLPQTSVIVGLHGADANTHDAFSTYGEFDSITLAIRILAAGGIPVHTIFFIERRNFYQLPAVIRLVEDLGGQSLRIKSLPLARKTGANENNNGGKERPGSSLSEVIFNHNELRVEELIALGWRIERELSYTTPVHLVFEQPPAFRGLHPNARVDHQERCSVLNSISITSTGQFTLCGLSQGLPGLILGEVGQQPLNEIWQKHPTLQLLREGLPEKLTGVCGQCAIKNTCLGSCPVENYIQTGSFWSPGWFCEAAERVGLFPAGRLIENIW